MAEMKYLITYGLIVGMAAGILSSIPCCNIFCCMWAIAGGVLAAYLLSRKGKVDLKEGALIGALAGAVAGVVGIIVDIIVGIIINTILAALMRSFFVALGLGYGGFGGMNPFHSYLPFAGLGIIGDMVVWAFTVVVYAVFGAIGGVLLVALMDEFGKQGKGVRHKPVEPKPAEKKHAAPPEAPST